VSSLAAFAWFVWLPAYRPALGTGERYGVDVSNHQGRIEWTRVARDGVSFAYIKATEGGDFVDHQFAPNWAAAGGSGLGRGAYHFFTLCAPGPAQAENFMRVLPDDPRMLPPAVDLELRGNCDARPGTGAVLRELGAFLHLVESATGREAVLYIGDDFESLYHVRSRFRRPIWARRFLIRPGQNWLIWQVDGFARVDGVAGPVDLDVMR